MLLHSDRDHSCACNAQEAHFGGSAMVDGKGYVPVMHAEMNGNISVVAGVNEIVQRLKDHVCSTPSP